jgi:hypothetical protein
LSREKTEKTEKTETIFKYKFMNYSFYSYFRINLGDNLCAKAGIFGTESGGGGVICTNPPKAGSWFSMSCG